MAITKSKKRVVKVWGVHSLERNDLAEEIFETKKKAQDKMRELAYHADPQVMKIMSKRLRTVYRIVPITVTYSI